MKIECLREKLIEGISKVEKITGKNITLPILSCILLEVKKNTLTLKSTNLDLGIEISVPVKVEKEGTVAVPGQIINNFLANISNGKTIKLEVEGEILKITTENNQAIIKTVPVDDFPTIPKISDGEVFKISSNLFIKGLKSVLHSASISNVKLELSSVYIHSLENELIFVATDSFRLAEKRIKVKNIPDNISLLIPFKNVADLLKTLDDVKEDIDISYNKNQISLHLDQLYLVSRAVDGNFPNYQQIIPKDSKTEVIVLKQDLISVLKISNIFSDSFNQINIKVLGKDKKIEFKTKNTNIGETTNSLLADINGEDIDINFNYKYIIDCFSSIDSDSISLQFNGINKPLLIKGSPDNSFVYIVMPMNK
ncbi:MAG: DNA polymerase III subunit beta [Minisyncoccia bacterium]